jgi:hypothetical protein
MRIDPNLVLSLVIAAVSVGGWFLLYALALFITRPSDVEPVPASQDFGGAEPPAVVSLLANRWEITEDAAESTLIDLAARKYLEFRQPANDPMQTTIHVRGGDMSALTPYERRVFDRVAALAVGGVVPLPALTFRDEEKAGGWTKRLRAEVVADARSRGLSQRRFSSTVVSLLAGAALVAAAGVGLAVALYLNHRHEGIGGAFWAGLVSVGFLSGFAGKTRGERDTPAGREVAARWLGLKAYLRNDESFANLPPSAVAVWDRYLSYGDALGVTRICSAVIDLGMGNRKRVWSSFGGTAAARGRSGAEPEVKRPEGTWHRVRVRYPVILGPVRPEGHRPDRQGAARDRRRVRRAALPPRAGRAGAGPVPRPRRPEHAPARGRTARARRVPAWAHDPRPRAAAHGNRRGALDRGLAVDQRR